MMRKMKQSLTPILHGEVRENELMGGALLCASIPFKQLE